MTLTDPDVIEHSTGISFSAIFSLREKLGDGGTAGVHKAVRDTGDEVAVKIVSRSAGHALVAGCLGIFEHEAEMLRLCAHSNVVSVFGLYQGPRDLALTLEMVPNGDMQQFLQRHGALAEHAVNAIILQLVRALAHVHSCGVLHRDVKLENLLVVHPGAAPHVKLCDFGHSTSDDCKKDGFTGTVGYAAPEVGGQNGRMPGVVRRRGRGARVLSCTRSSPTCLCSGHATHPTFASHVVPRLDDRKAVNTGIARVQAGGALQFTARPVGPCGLG